MIRLKTRQQRASFVMGCLYAFFLVGLILIILPTIHWWGVLILVGGVAAFIAIVLMVFIWVQSGD